MRWLTLTDIKAQLRIESNFTQEDTLLTMYGDAAEQFILDYLQRTEAELKELNTTDQTKVPTNVILASLMLVDLYYQQRGSVSMQNLYLIPYGFDALVSNYRKGTYSSEENENN